MGRHKAPASNVFAISKSYIHNPIFPEMGGVEYTKHHIQRGMHNFKPRWWIVDEVISKEEALALIDKHSMTRVYISDLGSLWETTPTLKSECQRLGLTYSKDLRRF